VAHTYALGQARTSSVGNPISFSYTVAAGDTVLCLMLKAVGSTTRAGGSPTWGSYTFTQANSTQRAVTTPEASAELWYILNALPGTATLTIPNTGALSCQYTIALGRAAGGGHSAFIGANGGNATSTNPTPGAVSVTDAGAIGFAITAGGWTTWAPSAQIGTAIANTDDGADGGGEQYILNPAIGNHTLSWTFATSDDWGAVSAYFKEIPPRVFSNYQQPHAASGISVGERIV
jgi:hypothetical protein